MSTTIITGRKLTISIDDVDYSPQVTEVQLVPSDNTQTYEVLTGSVAEPGITTWTLEVNAFQDWQAEDSFCEALWAAAADGDKLDFELTANTGAVFTGIVVAVYPPVGGAADAALEMSLSMPLDGAPDADFTPDAPAPPE
jgi:hypothetical protein